MALLTEANSTKKIYFYFYFSTYRAKKNAFFLAHLAAFPPTKKMINEPSLLSSFSRHLLPARRLTPEQTQASYQILLLLFLLPCGGQGEAGVRGGVQKGGGGGGGGRAGGPPVRHMWGGREMGHLQPQDRIQMRRDTLLLAAKVIMHELCGFSNVPYKSIKLQYSCKKMQ